MRIDHGPVQAMQVHHPPAPANDLPGAGNNVYPKESYRLLQSETQNSALTNREMCPMRLGTKVDGFERKGQAWFVATELQSDLVVEVGEMSFHLHKFPLLSRSGKLNRLVFDSRDVENSHIKLDDMPGGPETFELAAKFCYGVAVELMSANVAALRCAAEYLEMTEDLEEGNLVSKTEAFLSFVVLASWKDSIVVLQSCEKLTPRAEQLQIVRRCCESIAWKACTDPRGIRWSFTDRSEAKKNHASPLWSGPKNHVAASISDQVPNDWWFEDICVVCVDFFAKIISAIKVKGMRYDLIGSAVVHYAIKWLPGLTRDFVVMGNKDTKEPTLVDGSFLAFGGAHGAAAAATASPKEEVPPKSNELAIVQDKSKMLIEALIGLLPSQKDSLPCTFLLRLLRLAKMVSVSSSLVTDLEKRAGQLLDQGTLSDLLIPSFDHTCETLFDVDLVQRLLDYFLLQDSPAAPGNASPAGSDKEKGSSPGENPQTPLSSSHAAKMRVAKLIDNYLAEVGRDQNLTLNKFLGLAEALPEHTRVTDDGLYKALDTYLKAHPLLSEHERKKLCRTLDCQRLSLDACMHAAQNERLPLRVVVQVLFGEQIKLRNAVTGTTSMAKDSSAGHYPAEDDISIGGSSHESLHHDSGIDVHELGEHEHSEEEIRVLRSDVEKMKGKFMALQHDYSTIQQQLEKLSKHPKPPQPSGWKKLLPHHLPHFHTPHFISHPLEIFTGHHHGHGHGHGDHHSDGFDSSHHHSKKHDDHHLHSGKDHDDHSGHHKHHPHSKEHDSHHHQHNSKEHDSHHHHSKEHDSHHKHSKEHDSHHKHSKEHDSHHKHHQHSKDHDSHHHHHSKDVARHSKDHSKDHHQHHHTKDHEHHNQHHNHSKLQLVPVRDHHHPKHGDSHHPTKEYDPHRASRDHDAHRSSKDHRESTHSRDSHHSSSKDYHMNLMEHPALAQYAKNSHEEHHGGNHSHHSHHSKGHEDHHGGNHSHHSKGHEDHHVSSHSHSHHSKGHDEHRNSAHVTKDGDSRNSSSHLSSGEDSCRSTDAPTTPTHLSEHKKHRPFANAIRKWRNSIS